MRVTSGIARLIAGVWLLAACADHPSPHENFVNMLNSKVGKKWTDLRPYMYPSDKDLISSTELPNGNIENRYMEGLGSKRPCIHVYEIDPKTQIIVRADYEGRDEDCVAAP
jgi:hypothetical protein